MTTTRPSSWNDKVIEEFRASKGQVGGDFKGAPMVLITMRGAKSGIMRTIPLMCLAEGPDIVVFASKGGSDTNPAWYHNLKKTPRVTLEFGTEQYPAHARVAEGEERDRLFAKQCGLYPQFAGYQRKTKRTIPVVVLERKG